MRLRLLAALLLAGALAGSARADTLSLDDGRELEGTIVDESETLVRIRVARGQGTALVEVPRESVRAIHRGAPDATRLRSDAEAALAQGDRDGALRILRRLVSEHPSDAALRRELAFAELMGEEIAAARDDYARAVALDGTDVESLVGLGYTARRSGDRDAAIDAYRRASVAGPQHAESWRALAELFLERDGKGDRDDAVNAAGRALRAVPGDARNALLLADALARASGVGAREEHFQALEVLERFLREHPDADHAPAVAERAAAIAHGLGELERAKAAVAELVASHPPLDDAARERLLALDALYTWLAAGRPEPALGLSVVAPGLDQAAALRRLAIALEAAPNEGPLLLARARLQARGGHLLEAASDAARARDLAPEGPARTDAALVAALLQRLARAALVATGAARPEPPALEGARRTADLLPFLPAPQEELAHALEGSGDLAGARAAFERARDLSPTPERPRLAAEVERLEKLGALQKRNKDL